MSLEIFVIINLVIYLPFHLLEEAVGDFPKWMYDHKWLPYHMSHGHWMANNIFIYYPMLLASALLYLFVGDILTCFGIGVIVWGIINFGDHFFYTLKDRKISWGLFTGILFLINSVWGIVFFVQNGFSILHLILGIVIGGVLFGAPIGLCVVLYKPIEKFIK